MESYTIQRPRPSLLPAGCAPMSASWLPNHESTVVTLAGRTGLSQVHQVRVQAELAQTLTATRASDGTNGFTSSTGIDSAKRMTDGASGVPPRGRPV